MINLYNIGTLIFLTCFLICDTCVDKPKIAIIGAGIGGTSCAHFLTELFGPEVYIDIFEANDVGGRLKTEFVGHHIVELGGSVIHPKNRYMSEFVEKFGLKKKSAFEGRGGIFNGKKFVFVESDWSWINIIKTIFRYGLDIFFLRWRIDKMLYNFENIYYLQDRGITFDTVDELLAAMNKDFPNYRTTSVRDSFGKEYYKRSYFELIMTALRVNYGQGGEVHEFVGSVSMAGAMPGLWSVQGGNKMVAEALLNSSAALISRSAVIDVKYFPEKEQYEVFFSNRDLLFGYSKFFDVVVLAAPLIDNSRTIYFETTMNRENITFRNYHKTICTIVIGDLNHEFFGCETAADCPTEILTYNKNLFFSSVSRLTREKDIPVWKVFSNEVLKKKELSLLFFNYYVKNVVVWNAYPQYSTQKSNDSFILHHNLYHINAIEWAASAMEMSVIGARNVALMIFNNWRNESENYVKHGIIPNRYYYRIKDEL